MKTNGGISATPTLRTDIAASAKNQAATARITNCQFQSIFVV